MADVSAFTSIPLANQDPMQTASRAAELGNSLQTNNLIRQNVTNAQISGQKAQSDLNDSLNGQIGRATLAHVLYGEQTAASYKAEIDRQIAINPLLKTVGEIWKSKIPNDATPEQLRQQGLQHASAMLDPKTQTELGPNGQVLFVNDGQSQQPFQVPGGLGRAAGAIPYPTGQGVQNQPTPGDLLTPQTGVVTKELAKQHNLPDSAIGTPYTIPTGLATPYRGTPNNALTVAPSGRGTVPPPIGSVTPGRGGISNNGPMANPPQAPLVADRKPFKGLDIAPSYNDQTGQAYGPGEIIRPTGLPPKFDSQTGSPLNFATGRNAAPVQAAPAPQSSTGVPPGATPTGLPTGSATGIEQNKQAYRNAQTEAATLPLTNAQFIEAHNAIADLKDSDFTTGLGSGKANKVRQLLVQLGAGPEMVKNINNAATAEKYLAAAIANKAPGSDARMDLLAHATPSVSMPPGASLPIIRQIIASNRAKQAVLNSAPDKEGLGFLEHQDKQSRILNTPEGLKALSFDITPRAEQAQIIADLKAKGGDALKNFETALGIAHKLKLIGQ